jgi:hypothetical protein
MKTMKKSIIIGICALLTFTACETYNRVYVSLGITTDDLVGTWIAHESGESYGGEVGYDRQITWEITTSQIKESIYEESWDFENDGIINRSEATVAYTYDANRSEIIISESGTVLTIFKFTVNGNSTAMIIRSEIVNTDDTIGYAQRTFYRNE